MSTPPFELKKRQLIYAGCAGLFGLILIGTLLWSFGGDMALEPSDSPPKETNITTAGQRINPQEVWVERIESENKLTQEKLGALEKLLMASIQDKAIKEDQHQIPAWTEESSVKDESFPTANIFPPPPLEGQEAGHSSGVRKILLKLSNRILDPHHPERSGTGKGLDKSTLENTLPAGAFAKAILLGGVDASTSISSQADPRPVLLRVTDHGNLPRKFKSDLKACHILASCYGDLSSERVYMRLEKLTCTERLTGEISETQVAGYVVGEDGRAGVRGVVVDKAGPLIRNSLVGGFFSGMGQFFGAQQQRSTFPVSPLGQTQFLAPQQMLTAGVSQGASNALEKYADFFINRAEQLQPVLQVAAGREVDVVFTQGTKFGETTVRQSLSKIRNRSRKYTLQKLEDQGDSQSWLPLESPSDRISDNPQDGEEP
ncbi:MAG: TraB/VirB10 family protein [Alphaproteobacteria bacterium]|nr:TraB/VirB10 family protein [Alphaproteobacteria bacterium]